MSINYDSAVEYYDETRGYRGGIAERYREALVKHTGAGESARILEVGIGSGLIAQSFIDDGADYVGIDLSRGMMRLIRGKLAGGRQPRLAQADARHLPFGRASFDVVHAVRVFHHLPAWRECIDESRRLLRPGGALVIVENIPPAESDPPPWAVVQQKWDEILRRLGVREPGSDSGIWLTDAAMSRYLRAVGARTQALDLLRYREKPVSPRIMVERRAAGMFSSDWRLPEAIQREASGALVDWLERECEAPDELVEREMRFRALIARWR